MTATGGLETSKTVVAPPMIRAVGRDAVYEAKAS